MADQHPWIYEERLLRKVDPDADLEGLLTGLARIGWDEVDLVEGETNPVDGKTACMVTGTRVACGYCRNGAELSKKDDRIRVLNAELRTLKKAKRSEP